MDQLESQTIAKPVLAKLASYLARIVALDIVVKGPAAALSDAAICRRASLE